jgi:acylpyruvate hydrolase
MGPQIMKLLTVRVGQGTSAAVLVEGAIDRLPYADVGELLRSAYGLDDARRAVAGRVSGLVPPETEVLRPVLRPGAIFCVGLNYRTHILEMGRELPAAPTLFSKLPRALTDPYADVVVPTASDCVDYEGELCAVIGIGGRGISRQDALNHVAGYTVMNDVTMRDYQRRTIQWFAGKTWEAATPVGPVVVTPDELTELASARLTLTVNGDLRQDALVGDLVFDVPALIEDISTVITLSPGDLIATGTPGGVGHAMDPQKFLRDGDVVETAIAGIGTLRNRFVAP